MIFEAPYPSLGTRIETPEPEFGNNEALTTRVKTRRSRSGRLYTTVVTTGCRKTMRWTFFMHPDHIQEMVEFYFVHSADKVKVTDHEGRVWVGYFASQPLEIDNNSPNESVVEVQFEGFEQ